MQDLSELEGLLSRYSIEIKPEFDSTMKRGGHKKSQWFIGHEHGDFKCCAFGDFRAGVDKVEWHTGGEPPAELKSRLRETKQKFDEAKRATQESVAIELIDKWEMFSSELAETGYMKRKSIDRLWGARIKRNSATGELSLVVPMRDVLGKFWNFQTIMDDKGSYETDKWYSRGARVEGCYHVLWPASGEIDTVSQVFIAEGFATAASLAMAIEARRVENSGEPAAFAVLAAFTASNLPTVAAAIRDRFPSLAITICADNDAYSTNSKGQPYNVGFEKGREAAEAVGGTLVSPVFRTPLPGLTDFNDLHLSEGLDVVGNQVEGKVGEAEGDAGRQGEYPVSFFRQEGKKEIPEFEKFGLAIGEKLHLRANGAGDYIYENDFYRSPQSGELAHITTEMVGKDVAPYIIDQFVKAAKNINFQPIPKTTPNEGLINLNNGILDVKTRALIPHDPKYFFKYKLNHKFDPDAKCDEWLKWLSVIFQDDQERVDVIAEIIGYILVGGYPWLHRAFVLLGDGRNGKGTLLQVLEQILGASNITNTAIGLIDKPFSAISLDGKLALINGDADMSAVNSPAFKTLIGGEKLTAAHKGKDEFDLLPTARAVLAVNKMPEFKDPTAGSRDKLFIIPFNLYIEEGDRDGFFAQRVLFPEIPGILNWALDGLEKLTKRGCLPAIKKVEETKEEYRVESDSVFAYMQEWISFSPILLEGVGSYFRPKDYYLHYAQWCSAENRHAVSKIEFTRRIVVGCRGKVGCKIRKVDNVTELYGFIQFRGNKNGFDNFLSSTHYPNSYKK